MSTASEQILQLVQGIAGVQVTGIGDPVADPTLLPEVVTYPALFVYPIASESSGNNLATVAVRQTRTKFFRIVSLCKISDYDVLEDAVSEALIGKVIDPAISVSEIVHVRGNLTSLTGSLAHWQNDFSYRVSPTYQSQ